MKKLNAAFWENPEKIGQNLAKIQQHSGKICEILEKKTANISAIFNENFEIREQFSIMDSKNGAKERIV